MGGEGKMCIQWTGYKVKGDMCSERHKMLPVRGERACLWMVRSNKPSERKKNTLHRVCRVIF